MSDIDKIKEVAKYEGNKLYENYSGRGMYGKSCIGISTEYDPQDVIADVGVKGARIDSLGKRHIVYWPALSEPIAAICKCGHLPPEHYNPGQTGDMAFCKQCDCRDFAERPLTESKQT